MKEKGIAPSLVVALASAMVALVVAILYLALYR